MSTIDVSHSAPEPVPVWGKCREAFARVVRARIEEWMVRRAVKALHALDDRTLKDIGLTRSEIGSCARWRRDGLPAY